MKVNLITRLASSIVHPQVYLVAFIETREILEILADRFDISTIKKGKVIQIDAYRCTIKMYIYY
ncbi:hypothetical protein KSZ_18960 [Dictyobacter formicarum]|uniref:Uncharacterized protein n=1 Tax=Dictyobacter formicarum TaxID=2778368 RepID=A0ABQ3VD33_9CHLR|nr:hypothetical protein KSZ_18960 [Dictyobacter formicarum]